MARLSHGFSDTMHFIVFPVQKHGKSAWCAFVVDDDEARLFSSDRHILKWCNAVGKRCDAFAEVEFKDVNYLDVAI